MRGFNYARGANNAAPRVQAIEYTSGQTFTVGALLVLTSAGRVSECAADPASVYGIALQGAGTGHGYGVPNVDQTTVFTGRTPEVSVLVVNHEDQYYARAVNGGTDPVIPLQTHIGEQYGVAKVGAHWVIDIAETSAKVVEIVDILPENNYFVVKFLHAVLGAA